MYEIHIVPEGGRGRERFFTGFNVTVRYGDREWAFYADMVSTYMVLKAYSPCCAYSYEVGIDAAYHCGVCMATWPVGDIRAQKNYSEWLEKSLDWTLQGPVLTATLAAQELASRLSRLHTEVLNERLNSLFPDVRAAKAKELAAEYSGTLVTV